MQLSINFSRSHHPISRLALMKRWSRNFSTNRRERKRGKEKEMAVMMQKKKKSAFLVDRSWLAIDKQLGRKASIRRTMSSVLVSAIDQI